jgi:integrase
MPTAPLSPASGYGTSLIRHHRQSQCPSIAAKAVTPHTIRHTTAMHLLRAGNDVNMISYWLGHANINTTHIYVEIDMEMKRRMLQKVGAPAVNKPLPWQKPDVLQWLKALPKMPQLCTVKY